MGLFFFRGRNQKKEALDPRYVAGRLASLLGERGEGSRIERILGGTNAYVARVVFPGGTDAAVRWWPWVSKKRKGAEHAHLSALLAGQGIPIPQFLVHDASRWTRWRYGGEATVERWLGAPSFEPPWTDAELGALGALSARLHAIESPKSGKLWRPINEQANLSAYIRHRWTKCLITARASLGGGPPEARTDQALRAGVAWIASRRSFELVHGDLSAKNLFRGEARSLFLCDLGAMAFGCFEQELAVLEGGLFRDQNDRMRPFLDSYFAASPGGRAETWFERGWFFRAVHHLEKASANVRRAEKSRRSGRNTPRGLHGLEAAQRHWAEFAQCLEG